MSGSSAERSAIAEARFRARLADLGAELLEPYRGRHVPVLIRCAVGHVAARRPGHVMDGRGCRTCAGNDPTAAAARLRARLADLGAELLEPYRGAHTPHRVRLACGHESLSRPSDLYRGAGYCSDCRTRTPGHAAKRGREAAAAEAAFRARLADLGAELLEPYRGNSYPHRARCRAGHECVARWSHVQQGGGVCLTCAGHDPAAAEAAFRARLADLGAELLEPYRGANTPHRVRCAAGHDCAPTPGNIWRGQGPCQRCAGQVWDVFYVVADQAAARIKFGVTSGDPRPRLGAHRADGYRERVLVLEGLPGTIAPEIEAAALAALKLAGVKPIRGREYYDAEAALAVVLDIAENYPGGRASDVPPMRMEYVA